MIYIYVYYQSRHNREINLLLYFIILIIKGDVTFTTPISRTKGCSGNVIGDGPGGQKRSIGSVIDDSRNILTVNELTRSATQIMTPTILFQQRFGIIIARHRNKHRVIRVLDVKNVNVQNRCIQTGDIIIPLNNRNIEDCTEFEHFRNIPESPALLFQQQEKQYQTQQQQQQRLLHNQEIQRQREQQQKDVQELFGFELQQRSVSHNTYCVITSRVSSVHIGDVVVTKNNLLLHECRTVHDISIYSPNQYRNRNIWKSILQEWDDCNPCRYCGYVYLKSMRQRSICCQHGKCLNAMYPILKPIPQHFLTQILQDIPHWAEKSIY